MRKSPVQINLEIDRLKSIKKRLKFRYSAFGDDHYASIDAQVVVLENELDADDIDAFFKNPDINSLALDTMQWMDGDPVDCSPSEAWEGLYEDAGKSAGNLRIC